MFRRPGLPLFEDVRNDGPVCWAKVVAPVVTVRQADSYRAETARLLDGCDHLVIDLSNVVLVDSAGLGAIIHAVRTAREADKELSLVAVTPDVRTLFQLVRLHDLVDLYNDVDEVRRVVAAPAVTEASAEAVTA